MDFSVSSFPKLFWALKADIKKGFLGLHYFLFRSFVAVSSTVFFSPPFFLGEKTLAIYFLSLRESGRDTHFGFGPAVKVGSPTMIVSQVSMCTVEYISHREMDAVLPEVLRLLSIIYRYSVFRKDSLRGKVLFFFVQNGKTVDDRIWKMMPLLLSSSLGGLCHRPACGLHCLLPLLLLQKGLKTLHFPLLHAIKKFSIHRLGWRLLRVQRLRVLGLQLPAESERAELRDDQRERGPGGLPEARQVAILLQDAPDGRGGQVGAGAGGNGGQLRD